LLPSGPDTPFVQIQGGDGAALSDPLAETLDPEQRGATGVEDVEALNIFEQGELAIAHRDEVFFELVALRR
jgi:hypothetical protein